MPPKLINNKSSSVDILAEINRLKKIYEELQPAQPVSEPSENEAKTEVKPVKSAKPKDVKPKADIPPAVPTRTTPTPSPSTAEPGPKPEVIQEVPNTGINSTAALKQNLDDLMRSNEATLTSRVETSSGIINEFKNTVVADEPKVTTRQIAEGFPDLEKIPLKLTSFSVTDKPSRYLEYKAEHYIYAPGKISVPTYYDDVTRPTNEIFKYGLLYARIGISAELCKYLGVTSLGGIPIAAKDVFNRPDFPDAQSVSPMNFNTYCTALLLLIAHVMRDQEIMTIPVTKVQPFRAEDNQYVSAILQKEYPVGEANPCPGLIPISNVAPQYVSDEVQNNILEAKEYGGYDSQYKYGEVAAERARMTLGRTSTRQAINIDHLKAEVLNGNFISLRDQSEQISNFNSCLQAHTFDSVDLNIPGLTEAEYILTQGYDQNLIARGIMVMFILNRELMEYIINLNISFISDAGVCIPLKDWNSMPDRAQADATYTPLSRYLRLIQPRHDMMTFIRYLSMEIAPLNCVLYLKPTHANLEVPESILYIYSLVIFCVYFPRLFNEIKGEIGDICLKWISIFAPMEHTLFLATYGRRCRLVNDRPVRLDDTRDWRQSDEALSDIHHSFFAPWQNFNNAHLRWIGMLRNLFMACGQYVRDDRALNAGFVRINEPYHYIPYTGAEMSGRNVIQATASRIREYFSVMVRALFERNTNRGSTREAINAQMMHMLAAMSNTSVLFCSHMAPVLMSVVNQRHNFSRNFDGNISTFKPQQYVLTDEQGPGAHMINASRLGGENDNVIDPSVVFVGLYGIDGPSLRAVGEGVDGVSQDMTIPVPSAKKYEFAGRDFYDLIGDAMRAYSLISIIQGGPVITYVEFKMERGNIVNWIQFPDYQNQLVGQINNVINITPETTIAQIEDAEAAGIVNFTIPNEQLGEDVREYLLQMDGVFLISRTELPALAPLMNTPNLVLSGGRTRVISVDKVIGVVSDDDMNEQLAQMKETLPKMRGVHFKNAFQVISNQGKFSQTTLGQYLVKHSAGIATPVNMTRPQIRRADGTNNPMPFNPDFDHPAFENVAHLLGDDDRRRLATALKLGLNEKVRPRRGIRIAKTEVQYMDATELYPIPDGIPVVDYTDNMFRMLNDGARGAQPGFEDDDGVITVIGSRWRRIHLIMSKDVRYRKTTIDAILKGVQSAGWIVDFPHIYFGFDITHKPSPEATEDIMRFFTRPDELHYIIFVDTKPLVGANYVQLGQVESRYKYVYPLEDIGHLLSARDWLNNEHEPAETTQHPNPREYTTGELNVAGQPIYNDGIRKSAFDDISMSNQILTLSRNIRTTLEIEIEQTQKTRLYDIG